MEWYYALALMIGMLIALMAIGLPVAFAFFTVNLVGALIFLGGEAGLMQLVRSAVASVKVFSLAPTYTIWVGEPGTTWWEPIEGLRARSADSPADPMAITSDSQEGEPPGSD